jgi:predicted DNA-binding transcriptional regulator YafY
MPENKDFALRIEIIDECLRNTYQSWTLQSLTDTVNKKLLDQYGKQAARRTIQSDLKYLRDEKLAPLKRYKRDGLNYFTYSDPGYSIKNIPVDVEEMSLLQDAISILRQVNDFKIVGDVQAIIDKLQNTLITNIPDQPCLIQFEKQIMSAGTSFIDPLFAAIKEQMAMRIAYQPFDANQQSECVYHPYLLKEYRNRWFLLCRKESDRRITTLALDRIKRIRNSSKQFIGNDLFHPETYFNYLIGVTVPEHEIPTKIVIRVAKRQAPYLLTKPIHHTQVILETLQNMDIIICVYLVCNFELNAALLSYGPDIEVLEPATLRNQLKDLFEVGAKLYHPI